MFHCVWSGWSRQSRILHTNSTFAQLADFGPHETGIYNRLSVHWKFAQEKHHDHSSNLASPSPPCPFVASLEPNQWSASCMSRYVGRTRLFSSSAWTSPSHDPCSSTRSSLAWVCCKYDRQVSILFLSFQKLTSQHAYFYPCSNQIKVVESPRSDAHPLLSFVPSPRSLDPHNLSRTILESTSCIDTSGITFISEANSKTFVAISMSPLLHQPRTRVVKVTTSGLASLLHSSSLRDAWHHPSRSLDTIHEESHSKSVHWVRIQVQSYSWESCTPSSCLQHRTNLEEACERDHIRFRIGFQQGIHKNSCITYKTHITQCFDDLIERNDIRNQIDFDHGLDELFRRHHGVVGSIFNQSRYVIHQDINPFSTSPS